MNTEQLREYNRERMRAWRARRRSDPDWRSRRNTYQREKMKSVRATDPTFKEKDRDRHQRAAYGITLLEKGAMLQRQGDRCRCCGTTDPGGKLGWQTEHDHSTGVIRGIVCNRCNTTLALLGDNESGVIEACERFLKYLRSSPP